MDDGRGKMDDKDGMVGWEKPGFGDKVITIEVGGRRSDGWMIRMNRMLGWKKPGDKDKVITIEVGDLKKIEVGDLRSEGGGRNNGMVGWIG